MREKDQTMSQLGDQEGRRRRCGVTEDEARGRFGVPTTVSVGQAGGAEARAHGWR